MSREIRKILTERARNFNIALDDVSITSLSFGKEFTHAIEAKQVAAQEAERAKFIVEKAEQDKRSAIIRAQVRRKQFFYKHDTYVWKGLGVQLEEDAGSIDNFGFMLQSFICRSN